MAASALECDLIRSDKGVVGCLGLSGTAVCSEVNLVDAILKRLCVISAARERKSLIWSRRDTASKDKGKTTGEKLQRSHRPRLLLTRLRKMFFGGNERPNGRSSPYRNCDQVEREITSLRRSVLFHNAPVEQGQLIKVVCLR